ncbi:MAG: hypothetical protein KAT70_08495, partial [Thermoplasmata archaeon]|nr:hypothetical protein [Thermoplasmata archaeon]
ATLPDANVRDIEFSTGSSGLDIGGWQIVCDLSYSIPAGTVLDSSDRVYTLYLSDFPAGFDMTTGGDNVYLYNDTGALVDMFGWNTAHQPDLSATRVPDGEGTHLGYNDRSSIQAEWVFNSTPSMEQILPIITEVRWDDAQGRIEVHNPTNQAFDLTSWNFQGYAGSWDNTDLIAGGYTYYTLSTPGDEEGFTLTLLDYASNPVATARFGNLDVAPDPSIGQSTARYWNGTAYMNVWTWDSTPTFGVENDVVEPSALPPVVLNEVLYYTDAEWEDLIELTYNPISPQIVYFMDDMESGDNGWTTVVDDGFNDHWQRSTQEYNSPSTAWHLEVDDSEPFGTDNSLVSPVIDLTDSTHPMLEFWSNLSAQWFDYLNVEVYDSGWDIMRQWEYEAFTGMVRIDLTGYGGLSNFRVRFRIDAGTLGSTPDTWTVDDVALYEFQDLPPFWTENGGPEANNVTAGGSYPNSLGWVESGGAWANVYGNAEASWLRTDAMAIPDDGAYLVFEHKWNLGAGDDLELYVSAEPYTSETLLDSFTGTQVTYVNSDPYDLSAYAGQSIMFSWNITADSDGDNGNWYLENISVKPYSDPGFDLAGYKILIDDPTNMYTIPSVILNPLNNYFTINETLAPSLFAELTSGGDNVYLYDPSEQLLDMVGWNTQHTMNRSVARVPEGYGSYNGYNDTSSEAAGWMFDQTPSPRFVSIEEDSQGYGDMGTEVWYNLTVTNHGPADTITLSNTTLRGW